MEQPDVTAICSAAPDEVRALHSIAVDPGHDWIKLLPFGTFGGRDGRGPYSLPATHAQSVLDATRARAGSMDLVVDYDHQTDLAAVAGVGGQAPAAGWIKELAPRGDGIYARVEWTARASEKLGNREYRYISPVFDHTRAGGVVTRILRAGLTNNPNLDLMTALAAAQSHGGSEMEMFLKQLAAALGLPEAEATETKVVERVTAAAAAGTALGRIATAIGKKADDKADDIITAVQAAAAAAAGFDKAAKAVGKTAADSADDVVTAINAAKVAGAPDPAKYVPIDQVSSLQAQVNSLVQRDVEADVDKAIQSGKVAPSLRSWATDLRKSDKARFDAFLAGAPTVIQSGSQLTVVPADVGQNGGLTNEERAVASALGQSEETFLKTKKGMS